MSDSTSVLEGKELIEGLGKERRQDRDIWGWWSVGREGGRGTNLIR